MYLDFTSGQGAAFTVPAPATISQKQAIKPAANDIAKFEGSTLSTAIGEKGTWFDQNIDIRAPEGDILTQRVLQLIAEVETRRRKLKPADTRNRYELVRAILANGLRCHLFRNPHLVAYSRRTGGYRDSPDWLNGAAMATVVDLMAKANLVDTHPGKRGLASTYRVSSELFSIAIDCGITEHSLIHPLSSERLIRLRIGNSQTDYLPFLQTDDTRRWAEQLEAYNAFIRSQDVALSLTEAEEAEWVRHWNEERIDHKGRNCPALSKPELFKIDLYRQFNNGSFDQGGRLYGGWWINAPKWLRKRIMINGNATVEPDYSGCHIRMLYHQRGIDYQGEPYQLDELTDCAQQHGLPDDYFREGVKALVQALINGNPGGRPEQATIKDFSFKPYFTRPQLRRMIEEKHAPIADTFGTGAGLTLQRHDSDIALAIITRLQAQGIAAVPVHDSFIVEAYREGELRRSMEEEYMSIFSFKPIIKNDDNT